MAAISLIVGCLLDALLGEARRWHPLVGFGRYAMWVERRLHGLSFARARGVAAWCLAVLPFAALALFASTQLGWIVDALLLYFALGARSLAEHARAVLRPLMAGDLAEARVALSGIVSRDTAALDSAGVAAATIESVLENGNDAVFGTLFWFAVLGGPGALLFRLANTLDAMWGYRTPRYLHFGWAAARIDDVLNFIPARLTAFSYALLGRGAQARACWRAQAPLWDSPNAGPVMAAGAGALGVQLGGPARYHDALENRPQLGCGPRPAANDIARALVLVRNTQILWCLILVSLMLIREAYV